MSRKVLSHGEENEPGEKTRMKEPMNLPDRGIETELKLKQGALEVQRKQWLMESNWGMLHGGSGLTYGS